MRIPRSNLFLMIVSALLAVILWIWVGAEERSEIIVSVPLEYRNLPRDYEISSKDDLLSKVNVWVRGGSATIKNLQAQEISVWLDLKDTRPGAQIFSLTNENVRVPYGLTVLRISPPQVALTIEEILSRTVPVVPRLEGALPEGYVVTQKVVTPPQVEIVGPKTAVNSVREAVTDSIDISEINTDQVAKVKVGVENSAVRLASTREVTVLLRVSEIEDILTLRVPVTVMESGRNVKLIPKMVRVDVRAPRSILAKIKEPLVHANIETKELGPGMYELTPQIVFDLEERKRISIQAVVPPRVRIRIQ
ncbi:MAG TPA: CdaR family protein [Acidobacteriota bacterium]|nr:CdaR family protein [Acidobacteriota bacterium]